jgi:putative transposase
VHLLISLGTSQDISAHVRELKKASSTWAKERHVPEFKWQEGYAAFTVSWTHLGVVRRCIESQEQHHKGIGFVEELKQLLRKNGLTLRPEDLV